MELKNRETTEKINEAEIFFLENLNKIEKSIVKI